MDHVSGGTTFKMWVRRYAGAEPTYSLRFEVSDGKGLLRVVRPGVLIDPPARQAAQEDGLSGSQVRASRFMLVRESARNRLGHGFSRLEDPVLDRIDTERWVELRSVGDGGARQLVVLADLPPMEGELVDDEPTSPQRMLADLRDDLNHVHLVELNEDHTPVAPLGPPPGGDHVEAELADWAGTYEVRDGGGRWAAGAQGDMPLAPRLLPTEVVVQAEEVTGVDPIPTAEDPDAPGGDGDARRGDDSLLHERRTTLVRFFRRRQMRDLQRIVELEARLKAIEAGRR